MLWLKKPNVFSQLPLNLLISNAYSTIYSDDNFWNSFVTRLNALKKRGEVSENDFKLVRWDRSLIEKVHETSIETGEDFENEDIFDIVESIKKEHFQVKDDEINNLKRASEESLERLSKEKQEVELVNFKKNEKIESLSNILATIAASSISVLLILAVIYALFLTIPKNPFVENGEVNLGSWIAIITIGALMLLTLGNLIFGSTIKDGYHWGYMKVKTYVTGYFN